MKKSLLTISLITLAGFVFLLVPVVLPRVGIISQATKLEEFKIGDKGIDKEIDKIIKLIKNSLEDKKGSLWLDDWHLKPEIKNIKVFNYQRQAVKIMLQDIKDKRLNLSEEIKGVFNEVINNLVESDKLLARTIIEDAKAIDVKEPRLQKTVEHLIAKAEEEYQKALEELEKPNQERAITRFSRSWLFAELAIKIATKEFKLDEKDFRHFDVKDFIKRFDNKFNWEEIELKE